MPEPPNRRRMFVALDLEATDANPESGEIIEVGAILFNEEEAVDSWQTFVKPQRFTSAPIPYKVTLLTGIEQRDVETAPLLHAVAPTLRSFVKDYPIVGHSIDLDLNFLEKHHVTLSNRRYDTFELSSLLLPQLSNYRLVTVARALGIEVPSQHRAVVDADVSRKVFLAFVSRIRELSLDVLEEINRVASPNWPLRQLFADILRENTRSSFALPVQRSIREQLAAKGMDQVDLDLLHLSKEHSGSLEPKGERRSIDVEEICQAFRSDGILARAFPAYEHRPQQVQMMEAVADALNVGKHLLIEAGTGTGKSVAYLVPAIQFAVENGERIVISTNTLSLQDQLFHKDLPDLRRALEVATSMGGEGTQKSGLPPSFRATLVKGRGNYLCLRRWSLFRRKREFTAEEARVLVKILLWLPNTSSGDSSELLLINEEQSVWSKVRAERENCVAGKCPYQRKGLCFLYRARREAERAHIIVVNHALLLSDMAVGNQVLPDYQHVIVDEAHYLEEQATNQFGYSTDQEALNRYLDRLSRPGDAGPRLAAPRHRETLTWDGLLAELKNHFRGSVVEKAILDKVASIEGDLHEKVDKARRSNTELFSHLATFLKAANREKTQYTRKIRINRALRAQPAWSEIEIVWDNLNIDLQEIQRGLNRLLNILQDLEGTNILEYDDLLAELNALLHFNEEFRSHVSALFVEPSPAEIYWASVGVKSETINLHSAPLHVGDILEKELFAAKRSVVLTSATVSIDGKFDYIRERLGLKDPDELLVGSPFDYARSTLLYIPNDMPEPDHPAYQNRLKQVLIDLCTATGGRTLVLFTSYTSLRKTYEQIQQELARNDILVLGHGKDLDGHPHKLLERFKSNPRSVLLGTKSFWQGIDVVGEALSVLVIAKLPFDVPTDPVVASRSEMFADSFGEYSVPQTALRLKQGFGRLIRSKTDRGVVVILDRRVTSKSYGSVFIRSLPACTTVQGSSSELPARAAQWLQDVPVLEKPDRSAGG